jgi:murein L,D-transpeptidase YcbB/YkuD
LSGVKAAARGQGFDAAFPRTRIVHQSFRIAFILAAAAACIGAAPAPTPSLSPADGQTLIAVLAASPGQGFRADAFGQARASQDSGALLDAAIAYARAQRGLRLAADDFPPNWSIRPKAYDARADLSAAITQGRVDAWASALPPQNPGYTRLIGAHGRYQALAARGGWPSLSQTVKPGDQGPSVSALRTRLTIEDSAVAPGSDIYDNALADAVKRAQARHGLAEDGVVGAATLRALNVSAADRARQIALNLERWRWMPRDLPAARAELNIAAATLQVSAPGSAPLGMRVIVGQPKKPTPMFTDAIKAVVLNPPWNVPQDIAVKEIWPKIRKDPGYMAKEGFVVKPDGGLQQLPGPRCALGAIKFDLSNSFGVYLHDTPSRSLFAQPNRALSHGCMRLEQPNALAKRLLADDPNWSEEAIDVALLAGRTVRVTLRRPLPLYVGYWTAFVDEDGTVQFRPDVYGWDAKLEGLLPSGPAG